jgi:hypothetical protein
MNSVSILTSCFLRAYFNIFISSCSSFPLLNIDTKETQLSEIDRLKETFYFLSTLMPERKGPGKDFSSPLLASQCR